ncbi:MAG: 3'-5' exonuclease, partial [Saprospiraceae bacterium]
QHPVIFCDEAQDFTKIEIEYLLRLSIFTKYNLSHYSNIPFSFAGDPYQTINPTGFRWETLKTIFNDRFEKLNPKGLSIRFEPLSQNYRSKPAIIKFTNLIQGFRYSFLKIHELRPQSAWQKMEGVSPCIFILNQDITAENLKGVAEKTIILIPTDADENKEYEYVENDEILKHFIQLPEDKNTPISNVMSASTSKGLEFDRVVLYNFGKNSPSAFKNAISGIELNDSEFIELSHYFNKLYVALSRARNFLFIIDTSEGYDKFWQYFMTIDILKSEFEKGSYWSESDVSSLSKGLKADIDNIREENPLKIAKELEENGTTQSNYALLIRAQQYYKLEGKDNDALRCEAWALWFKENWIEAGKSFNELGEKTQASKSYWKGQAWQLLQDLYETQGRATLEKIIAEYMLNKCKFDVFLSNDVFIEKLDINNETWKSVVLKIQKDFEKTATNDFSKFAELAKKIAGKGFKLFYNFAGNLYFKDRNYESAIDCWDRNEYKEHPEYYSSKLAISSDINDKIFWHQKLKQDDEIITISKQQIYNNLHQESHNIIFGALLRKNEFEDATSYSYIPIQLKVKRLLDSINGFSSIELINQRKRRIFNLLLDSGNEGIDILKNNLSIFQDFFDNKDAIRLILKQENWKDLLDELNKELRSALPGKFIESFVDVVCEELEKKDASRLFYAINLVGELNKRDDKLTENIKLIKAIAYSDVTPEFFSFELRERLESFVTKCVWEKTGWRGEMNFKEIGTALERLGAKSITLQNEIYEYIIQYETEFAEWAKLRWIKVAQRRANYEKSQGRIPPARKIESDIKNKIKEWRTQNEDIANEPEYPMLKENKVNFIKFQNAVIYGFINEPKMDDKRKRITIELENYEIRINCASKLVSVEDLITNKTVDIDLNTQEIGGLGVLRSDNSFEIDGKYKGNFANTTELKLDIEELNLKLIFE